MILSQGPQVLVAVVCTCSEMKPYDVYPLGAMNE